MLQALHLLAPTALTALVVASAALAGCAGGSSPPAPTPGEAQELARRISALETRVRRDRERVVELLTMSRSEDGPALREDPELRAISRRLPDNQAELARLVALPIPVARTAGEPPSAEADPGAKVPSLSDSATEALPSR
jgi:hypothetical protein